MAPTVGYSLDSSTKIPNLDLPPVAILLISIGCYLVILSIILIIRQILLSRGLCKECSGLCGSENDPRCCECCIALSDACDCKTPTINKFLDSCCPRRNLDCIGLLLCQCCPQSQVPGQDPCCSCGDLNFNCACVDSNEVNCLCCQVGNNNYYNQEND